MNEVVQLKDIVNLRRETMQPNDSNKKLNFVGLKYIDSGVSTLKRWGDASEVKSTKAHFYPNDVLYGRLNPHLDKAIIAEIEGICSTDILVFTANPKMIPRFLVYLLHSHSFRSHAMATASGITLPRTSWSALGEFTFALPSLSEQKQIVSEIERCLSIADGVEATIASELERAERLRQSILKQAFSGQLVPQDPNDEPASVLLERIQTEKEHQQPKRRKKTMKKSKAQDSDTYPLLALAERWNTAITLSVVSRWRNCEVIKVNEKDRDEFNGEDTDPLLALAGTLKWDVSEIKKQLKDSVRPKIRVVKGPYAAHPDPLIALLGTLECDVTDLGERHDDYIRDALLAELWGDEDE